MRPVTAHLSDERLIEALGNDGRLDEPSRGHLEDCETCAARMGELEETWRLVSDAEVPEPSPLYWDAFRRQVARRLDEARGPFPSRRFWIPGLAAVVAAGLVVASLVPWSPPGTSTLPLRPLPAWSALPEDDGTALVILEHLAPSDEDMDSLGAGGTADRLAELSDEESRSLADALRGEWEGRKL
jgi:hypothetical protein